MFIHKCSAPDTSSQISKQYLNLYIDPNKALSLLLYVYSFLESLSVKHSISGGQKSSHFLSMSADTVLVCV